MRATMDLIAIYNYDSTIFDDFVYPSDYTSDERGSLIANLLLDTAELEILYPQPATLKYAIAQWSAKEQPQWDKLYKTLHFDYNPIWNKDGKITESETTSRDTDENITDTHNQTDNMTGSTTDSTTDKFTGTVKHDVYGFNSDTDAPESKDSTDNTDQTDSTGSSKGETTSDATDKRTRGEDETIGRGLTRIEQGNIGVTTTQSMIQEEREVDKFNLDDYIIGSFKKRFCLMVY